MTPDHSNFVREITQMPENIEHHTARLPLTTALSDTLQHIVGVGHKVLNIL